MEHLVQNFAGRIVVGLISEGLTSLKWLTIANKLLLNDSTMVHKCLKMVEPLTILVKNLQTR